MEIKLKSTGLFTVPQKVTRSEKLMPRAKLRIQAARLYLNIKTCYRKMEYFVSDWSKKTTAESFAS